MAISAVVAVGTVVAGGVIANKAKNAANDRANEALAQAQKDQEAQTAIANRELAQAQQAQAQQQQQEAERSAAMAQQTLGAQNAAPTTLTPTVQLAAQGDGEASSQKARQRRAQFRPEYQSGVSI